MGPSCEPTTYNAQFWLLGPCLVSELIPKGGPYITLSLYGEFDRRTNLKISLQVGPR